MGGGNDSAGLPVDYNKIYPELNGYLIRPLLVSPPMCQLHQLLDGTYELYDLEVMHQVMDIKAHQAIPPPDFTQKELPIY